MVRFIKKLYPSENNEFYTEEQYMTYQFPQNIVDTHSITKYFEGNVDPYEKYSDGTYLKRFLPLNSSSVINEIQIKRDGEIVQIIPEYAILNQMYNDTDDDSYLNTDCEKTDTIFINELNVNNYEKRTADFYNTTTLPKYKYSITKWLGFLNPQNRYLDCRGKNIQIVFKLSPKSIAYRGLKTQNVGSAVDNTADFSNWHYYIRNCFMTMSIVDNENIDLDNTIYFDDFSHFKSMANPNNKNTIVKAKVFNNIKYMIGTFTDNNQKTDRGLQLQHVNEDTAKFGTKVYNVMPTSISTAAQLRNYLNEDRPITQLDYSAEVAKTLNKPNTLNNSIYFKRNGIDMSTNQFRVNGVNITPPFTALESFNNVKHVFNTQLKKVSNLASFINDFFMNVVMYNSNKDEVSNVEWEIVGEGKNVGGHAHLFIVHNKSVKF